MGFSLLPLVLAAECSGWSTKCGKPNSGPYVPTTFPLNDSNLGAWRATGITSHILGMKKRLRSKLKKRRYQGHGDTQKRCTVVPHSQQKFYQLPPAAEKVSDQRDGLGHYSRLLKISSLLHLPLLHSSPMSFLLKSIISYVCVSGCVYRCPEARRQHQFHWSWKLWAFERVANIVDP